MSRFLALAVAAIAGSGLATGASGGLAVYRSPSLTFWYPGSWHLRTW